jgi:hypothetical protein
MVPLISPLAASEYRRISSPEWGSSSRSLPKITKKSPRAKEESWARQTLSTQIIHFQCLQISFQRQHGLLDRRGSYSYPFQNLYLSLAKLAIRVPPSGDSP